jgi:hypothetical protein
VTRLAQRLQVPAVEPPRIAVSLMRDDVIDVVGRDVQSALLALPADRLFTEYERSEAAPV